MSQKIAVYKLISVLVLMLFAIGFASFTANAANSVTVISPYQGEHITLINPYIFVFNLSIYAPQYVNYPVAIDTITGPDGIGTTAPIAVGSIGSNGYLNVTPKFTTGVFEQNGEPLKQFVPGTYYISLDIYNVFYDNISVVLTPNDIATLNISAIENGKQLPGATIDIYNESNGALLVTGTTNANGYLVEEVPYVYTMSNTYNITLTKAGYQFNYTTVTVPANYFYTVPVKIYTEPVVFAAVPIYYEDMGIKEIAPPQQVNGVYQASAFQNTTFSVIINVTESGVPVSSATVTAQYNNTHVTAVYIGDGMYNLSIMMPEAQSSVPYTLVVAVTAQYHSTTTSFYMAIAAEPNLYQEIALLKTEVATMNSTIYMLKSEIALLQQELKGNVSYLNSTIYMLKSEIASLNSSLISIESEYESLNSSYGTLSSEFTTLSSQVTTLSNQVHTLNASLSSLQSEYNSLKGVTTLTYIGIALAVIGLIIAIIAIILVLRKVA